MERIGSFVAIDSSGRERTVLKYETRADAPNRGNPSGTVGTMRELRLEDGSRVERDGQGKYHIRDTGERLTSNDPDAP